MPRKDVIAAVRPTCLSRVTLGHPGGASKCHQRFDNNPTTKPVVRASSRSVAVNGCWRFLAYPSRIRTVAANSEQRRNPVQPVFGTGCQGFESVQVRQPSRHERDSPWPASGSSHASDTPGRDTTYWWVMRDRTRYGTEMMDVIREHIEILSGARGPKTRVDAHRTRVQDVASWHEQLGMCAGMIADENRTSPLPTSTSGLPATGITVTRSSAT
jgi:hypothetical protein